MSQHLRIAALVIGSLAGGLVFAAAALFWYFARIGAQIEAEIEKHREEL